MLAHNLRSKQKRFVADLTTITLNVIKELYRTHPFNENITLARFLCAMTRNDCKGKPLFYALEQDSINEPSTFHFHRKAYQQANELVVTLPLVIEGVFGERVAQKWINEDAWDAVENYSVKKIDPDNPMKGVYIKNNKEDTWQSNNDNSEFGFQDFEYEEGDGKIEFSNFDMLAMETKIHHVLNDGGESCKTSKTIKTLKTTTTAPASEEVSSLTENIPDYTKIAEVLAAPGLDADKIQKVKALIMQPEKET